MFYTIYKTINLINNKEYIGFHSVKTLNDIVYEESVNGSIFKDGYLGSGKLIKRALEKYGPLNMKQELILITDDREEAEKLESELVDVKWTLREDTYNIALGGNVRVMVGKNNPMYGKPLSKESLKQALETRKRNGYIFSWAKLIEVETNKIFYRYDDVYDYFNIEEKQNKLKKHKLYELVFNGVIKYESSYLHDIAVKSYLEYNTFIDNKPIRREKLAKMTSERFSGVAKSEESNRKRGKSISKWIEKNPQEHKKRMDKINKNPEKIKKTADKHRGMKRSQETKDNISKSLKGKTATNKGKRYIYNVDTLDVKMIDKNENLPIGWQYGYKPK